MVVRSTLLVLAIESRCNAQEMSECVTLACLLFRARISRLKSRQLRVCASEYIYRRKGVQTPFLTSTWNEPDLLIVQDRPRLGNAEEVGSIHAVSPMNLTIRHGNGALGQTQ